MDSRTIRGEMARRRTFAIISHPDAGKTTLTEKLLLYGGAIQLAGSVRARRNQKSTASDWMEIEKERGISISSTLLQFEYRDCVVNLLDTPGHKDFSEDTYRVLTAVDSVVMVMDAAKGVEERTRKLFEVCRMRDIPIFTFFNKMDRPARDPLELLDELEEVLGIGAFPVTWPLGSGPDFRGVYDRLTQELFLYKHVAHNQYRAPCRVSGIQDDAIRKEMSGDMYRNWVEEIDMLAAAGESFDEAQVTSGAITPAFFGSAMSNFGVQHLLDYFILHGAQPQPRHDEHGPVDPVERAFSGFVFKVQANMNPRHRDCLNFVRVCSGLFERDMTVVDPQGGKPVRLSYAQKLFGQDRESLEIAYPGDIVGLVTHKPFRIGDTLTADATIRYDEIPRFPPEAFGFIRNVGTAKYKQFRDGLGQLLDEGVIQSFRLADDALQQTLLGAVGQLQFDVVLYRLRNEYGAEPQLDPAPFTLVRWFQPGTRAQDREGDYFGAGVRLATDVRGQLVVLFPTEWALRYYVEKHPNVILYTISPHLAPPPAASGVGRQSPAAV
jgi:peptide chain release factor 3